MRLPQPPESQASGDALPVHARRRGVAQIAAVSIIAALGSLLAWSYWADGIVAMLFSQRSPVEKMDALRSFFAQFGLAAPLAYVGFVILEVVIAPLPGAMLYAPGGVLFGGFWGGLLSLSGNVLGAGLACQLMRTIFGESVQKWFALSTLGRHQERIEQNGAWLVFLLRLNPLTSSDLVSYAAGLTRLSVWKLMAATLAGMAPLCFAQAYFADGMLASFPSLIYPLAAGCVLYAGLAIWILVSLVSRPGPVADSQPPHTPPGGPGS